MKARRALGITSAVLLFWSATPGCGDSFTTSEKGALLGALLGAGTGAIVGHQSGHAGTGAAIGGGLGALSGGLIGKGIEGSRKQAPEQQYGYPPGPAGPPPGYYPAAPPPPPPPPPAPPARSGPAQPAVPAAPAAGMLTVEDVIILWNSGVSEETIIQRIEETGSVFYLTANDVDRLRSGGVTQRVIDHMTRVTY